MSCCGNSKICNYSPSNSPCNPCDNANPTKTNLATLGIPAQTVASLSPLNLTGSSYENGIKITAPDTITFYKPGLYSIQFVVTTSSTQAGPLAFGFVINGGSFASGNTNSTSTGLQVTGIGFAKIGTAPFTGQLVNYSNQPVTVTNLRLTIIKIS